MKIRFPHPALTAAAALACLTASDLAAQELKTAGLRVVRERVGEDFSGLIPFNSQKLGTTLAVLALAADGGSIIKLDTDNSQIDSFTDDKGTDLLTGRKDFPRDGFGSFPEVAADGSAALFEIVASGTPAPGATKLVAKGELVVHTASEKKTVKSKPFPLKKGAKFSVGEIDMVVKSVGKSQFREDFEVEIELETDDDAIELVAGVTFKGPDGAAIESDGAGSSRFGFGNRNTYGRNYVLKSAPGGDITLEFEMWSDFAQKKVPIDITASIGG